MPLGHPVLRSLGCEQFLGWGAVPVLALWKCAVPPHTHLFWLSVEKLIDNTGRSDISLAVIHLQVLLGGNFQVVRDVSSHTTWVPELCGLWQVTCPYPTPSLAPESYILAPTATPGLRDKNPVMCGKNLPERHSCPSVSTVD